MGDRLQIHRLGLVVGQPHRPSLANPSCSSRLVVVAAAAAAAVVVVLNRWINDADQWKVMMKTQSKDSDRVHEESREVGDGGPFCLNERRIGVEDDVAQTVRE